MIGCNCAPLLNHLASCPLGMADTIDRLRREHAAEKDLIFEDLRAILRALGLFDGARPISAHDVVQTIILPAIARLRDE